MAIFLDIVQLKTKESLMLSITSRDQREAANNFLFSNLGQTLKSTINP
jgi:hypothetical protein